MLAIALHPLNASLCMVEMPSKSVGLKILEQEVFYCCGFGSFVVPDGVVQIKEDAFANCWSLTRITIPESVTKIDADTFFNILSDIHIECYRDSYAHKWATSHKAKFELIEKPQKPYESTVLI